METLFYLFCSKKFNSGEIERRDLDQKVVVKLNFFDPPSFIVHYYSSPALKKTKNSRNFSTYKHKYFFCAMLQSHIAQIFFCAIKKPSGTLSPKSRPIHTILSPLNRGLLNPIWSFVEVIHIYFFDFHYVLLYMYIDMYLIYNIYTFYLTVIYYLFTITFTISFTITLTFAFATTTLHINYFLYHKHSPTMLFLLIPTKWF